ncbi:MAG: helix-turn-helix domain-containing protein [Pyrinomonadaceae bacterium]
MDKLDKEITEIRKRLIEMQRLKAKRKPPKKVQSSRPRGRPQIDETILRRAKELAKGSPIPDVALKLSVSKSTLYRYGIKRKILNAEKDGAASCDSTADLSLGTLTD